MKIDNILNIALLGGVGFGALYLYKEFTGVGGNVAKNIYDNAYDNYNPFMGKKTDNNPININFSTGVQDAIRDRGVYTPDGTRYYIGPAGSEMTREQFNNSNTGFVLSDSPLNIGNLGKSRTAGIGRATGTPTGVVYAGSKGKKISDAIALQNKYASIGLSAIKSASSSGSSSSSSSGSSSRSEQLRENVTRITSTDSRGFKVTRVINNSGD